MSYQRNNYQYPTGYSRGGGAPRGRQNYVYDQQNSQPYFEQQNFQSSQNSNRGGNRAPRQRGGSRNSIVKPSQEKVIDSVPKPQHLSKAPSEEKNDPLYAEAFFTDESQALAPEPDLKEIHSGVGGLETLVRSVHGYCISNSTGYAKRVPESVLNYYFSVYAYARMLDVQQSNFRGLTFDEKEFLAKVKEFENEIPKSLAIMLAGIGNTTCPNGRDLKFRMANRTYAEGEYLGLIIPGYFGQAGPHTQSIYKDYPCIAVAMQRIIADLGGDVNRDLPDDIRPDDPNAVHPNEKM